MKPMKRLTAVLLAAGLLLSLAACGGTENLSESSQPSSQSQQESSSGSEESSAAQTGGGRWDSLQATEEEVTLYVDLNNSTPTVNEEPTEESPTVRNAARIVAEQWLADKPNVSIEWTRNKVMGTQEAFLEWMTIQLNASTAPDVLHAWGAQFADKGWYLELDEVMESPNYYEPGNTSWKEMYPDYLWEDPMFINANNNIMAIPHTVYPGPPTVYYYNTQIFQELGIQETNDWATFHEEMQKVKEAGLYRLRPRLHRRQRLGYPVLPVPLLRHQLSGPVGSGRKRDHEHKRVHTLYLQRRMVYGDQSRCVRNVQPGKR